MLGEYTERLKRRKSIKQRRKRTRKKRTEQKSDENGENVISKMLRRKAGEKNYIIFKRLRQELR